MYYSKPQSRMARHLMMVHSDKTEVAAAFQYPKKSRERQKIWNRLRKEGKFAHNKAVLKAGKPSRCWKKALARWQTQTLYSLPSLSRSLFEESYVQTHEAVP